MEYNQEWLGVIIVMAPIVIFIFSMLIVMARLKGNVNLADMLTETEVEIKRQEAVTSAANATAKATVPEIPPSKRSASRLILFLSGITSLILGACFTTYYFYMNIYCGNCSGDMELSDFTDVLLALGIGVVPYAINQVKKFRL
ncbi:MAG: hypothetical protein GY816_17475 [Cytophagales bacterium]|nr:hypothetical protein [Cytophagales bacterium]